MTILFRFQIITASCERSLKNNFGTLFRIIPAQCYMEKLAGGHLSPSNMAAAI